MYFQISNYLVLTYYIQMVCSQVSLSEVDSDDETPPYRCKKDLKLRCQYSGVSPCCSSVTRIWRKDATPIMSDGVETSSTGKYKEYIDATAKYFELTIFNIVASDFEKIYVCEYGFDQSQKDFKIKDFFCYPCWDCCKKCIPWILAGFGIGIVINVLIYLFGICCCPSCCYTKNCFCHKSDAAHAGVYVIILGREYEKGKMKQKTLICIAVLLTILGFFFIHFLITALAGGTVCDACYDSQEAAFLSVGTGILIYSVIYHWTLNWKGEQKKEVDGSATVGTKGKREQKKEVDGSDLVTVGTKGKGEQKKEVDGSATVGTKGDGTFSTLRFASYVGLTVFVVPIPFLFLNEWYRTGGNNRSKESGSSCWPPCSVGPDPNSPDPENARSLLKKKADKKNEKKPVAVVRSQPPKNRHVKTDNTESTRYSAETEIFDEGVHKSAKPRPLPSIGQPTNSPRPLPQMPPSSQLEKGGIQLEPLGESTSEKKKKKRRKKKESKQSDEED